MHERLLYAYFAENRDTSDTETLSALWKEVGLPDESFRKIEQGDLLERVLREHSEAIDLGVGGVPAARRADVGAAVVGAHPIEVFRKWVTKVLNEDTDVAEKDGG